MTSPPPWTLSSQPCAANPGTALEPVAAEADLPPRLQPICSCGGPLRTQQMHKSSLRMSRTGDTNHFYLGRPFTSDGPTRTETTLSDQNGTPRHREWTEEQLMLTPEEAARVLHIGRSCRISRAELNRYIERLHAPSTTLDVRPVKRARRTQMKQGGLFDLDPSSPDAA